MGATNSKMSAYYIQELFFQEFCGAKLEVCVIHK